MSDFDNPNAFWTVARTVRERAPLVHNITNLVMQNDTADAIAAVGATQVTLHTVEEAREAAAVCGAVALNLGTLDQRLLHCAGEAVEVAAELGRPWVLDPVAVGLTRYRTEAAADFLRRRPTVVKANASEVRVLAGLAGTGRGADSLHEVEEAAAAARALAREHRCVVAVTGPEDLVTDGRRVLRVANGEPLLGRMIGSGCMLTSVIGAFLATGAEPLLATSAAIGYFGLAGELATARAGGPGTLKPLLIDALYALREAQLLGGLRVRVM